MGALVITPELEENARRLAEATGMTPTEAVADAVRQRLHLVSPAAVTRNEPTTEEVMARIRAVMGGAKRMMSDDEALGYDEHGLWTS